MSLTIPNPIEPLKANRFIIRFLDNNLESMISEYLFRRFNLTIENKETILKVEMFESTDYSFNPKDLTKINKVKIENLDPTGVIVNTIILPVKERSYSKSGDYGKDELLINNFKFTIDINKIELIYARASEGND